MIDQKLIADQAVLAAELNEMSEKAGSGDRITQGQFNARVKR